MGRDGFEKLFVKRDDLHILPPQAIRDAVETERPVKRAENLSVMWLFLITMMAIAFVIIAAIT
jgi:hypothetical protein